MDQAKWALPRLREFVNAKELGRYQRPKVKLHAIWAHSIGLHIYVIDPRQGSGANTVCETASRSLEKVAAQMGNKMPHHVLVMCDNTVKESKNSTVLSWMSTMIAKHRFRSGGIMMARVGHTHGPLGALEFALCYILFRFCFPSMCVHLSFHSFV